MSPSTSLSGILRSGALALAAAFLALPAPAAVDLVVQSVQWVSGPEIGPCNKLRIVVRNNGDELGNQITAAKVRIFPGNNPFQTVVDKNTFFSAFQPGQSQTREISNLELPGGTFTMQVTADADPPDGNGKLAESNENNNTFTQTNLAVNQACGGGNCDLKATFNGGQTTVPGTYPANLSVKYENVGGANCSAQQLVLQRFAGTSPSGPPTAVGSKALQALAPGQAKNVGWTDNDHPANGEFTYRPAFAGSFTDADPNNHSPTRTLSFKSGGGGGTGSNPSGCDLSATVLNPSGSTTSGPNVSFQVLFKNQGNATCNANKVKLLRYNGSRCSGYGSQVGGSGNFQTLPALAANGQATSSWTDSRVPKGTYCYQIRYASPHNDDNNANHQVQKKVTVN